LIPKTAYFNKIFFSPSSVDGENYKLAQNIPEIFRLATDEGFMEHVAERRFFYDTTSFEKLNSDLALFNSFNFPGKYDQAASSKSFTKIYSHYTTHLFARRTLTAEYAFDKIPDFSDNTFYIVKIASSTIRSEENEAPKPDKSYTLFDKQVLAQKLVLQEGNLSKIVMMGNKEGRMRGGLIVEIKDGLAGKTLYKKLIPASTLSYEKEITDIKPNQNFKAGEYF